MSALGNPDGKTTHTEVGEQIQRVNTAMTSLANAELFLTFKPDEDQDAWEQMIGPAGDLSDAAEALVDAVSAKLRAAEKAAGE